MEVTEYKEFRVIVEDRGNLRIIKPRGISWKANVPLDRDYLRERTINIFNRWLAEGLITQRDELIVLGTYLYEGLFEPEISKAFKEEWDNIQNQPSIGLRLVLEFEPEARELAEMPWEYIYYPDSKREKGFFLATRSKLILARHVPLNEEVDRVLKPQERPLRILIVVSRPERDGPDGEVLGTVNAGPVVDEIEKLKNQWPDAIVTDTLPQPTKRKLTEKVEQFRPHVLHFIGHGRSQGEGGALALVSEEDERLASWISDIDLPDCLTDYPPRLIFLHACEGAYSKSYRAFRGVALQLVYSKVPAVVAMQYQVENRVATSFARTFYHSLGEGKRIDEAVQAGRQELGMYLDEGQNFSSRAFGSPVVYLQSANGIIIAQAQTRVEVSPASSTVTSVFKCPDCFKTVTATQKFCFRCGKALMICPKCEQIMPKDGFCGNCGYRATSNLASDRVEPIAPPAGTRAGGQSSMRVS